MADAASLAPLVPLPAAQFSSALQSTSAVQSLPPTVSSFDATPLAEPTELVESADPASSASPPEHILDTQGFVKPADPPIQTPPPNDPTVPKLPSPSPRINRRTPAPIPDTLSACSRDVSPCSSMDVNVADLKRKLPDETPKQRREKKKRGRKYK